jgi:hypothetical protein
MPVLLMGNTGKMPVLLMGNTGKMPVLLMVFVNNPGQRGVAATHGPSQSWRASPSRPNYCTIPSVELRGVEFRGNGAHAPCQ